MYVALSWTVQRESRRRMHQPYLWRRGLLKPKHKKGDPLTADAWRMLYIGDLNGLTYEREWWLRVVGRIQGSLHPAQTGYQYACEDQFLILLAMAEHRKSLSLPLVVVLADLVKAFPRTWRDYVLVSAMASLTAEQFLCLDDMLSQNSVFITESGVSELQMLRGLAEGGYLGALLYPLLPDSLVRKLESLQRGPAMLPKLACSDPMHSAMSNESATLMYNYDRAADWRIPMLLHADDQAIPESSLQQMQMSLSLAEHWSQETEQEYHVTDDKTVVLFLTGHWPPDALARHPLRMNGQPLSEAAKHKWLGAVWSRGLLFRDHLNQRVMAVRAAVQSTLVLARSGGYPLHILAEMAEAKCKGVLLVGFVLLIMVPDADEVINKLQAEIAKALMRSHPYTQRELVLGELEWTPWWLQVLKQCLRKEASIMMGLGSPWVVQLFSIPEGMLAGRQWRQVLRERAGHYDLPTFGMFLQGSEPTIEAWREYQSVLNACVDAVWSRQWNKQCAEVLQPFP